jgi:hypothetical protein
MATANRQHDLELRELEAHRFSAQVARSIKTLQVGQKTVNRIYSERIKSLRTITEMIQQKDQLGQLKIDGMDCIDISPELKRLVYDPVSDLP